MLSTVVELLSVVVVVSVSLETSLELLALLESLESDESLLVNVSLMPLIALLILPEVELDAVVVSVSELLEELLSLCEAILDLICLYSDELTRTKVTVELLPRPLMDPLEAVNVTWSLSALSV